MRIFTFILLFLILALLLFGSFYYGDSIPFENQWKLFETLRTTASIILAIMAAWIAIIYPDRLKLFKNQNSKNDSDYKKFEILLHPIINSLVILAIVLLIGVVAPIASQIEFLLQFHHAFRRISYMLLLTLTIWQIYTVFSIFIPMHVIKRSNKNANDMQEEIERINKNFKD